jgi:hypothetical protein
MKKKAKFEVFEGLIRNLDKNWVWRMRVIAWCQFRIKIGQNGLDKNREI